MSKPLIPFGILPGHWGLKGKTREIARAEYELSGYELEIRLNELTREGVEQQVQANKIDLRYRKVTEEEYERKAVELTKEGDEQALANLDLDFKYKKITKEEREKLRADIKKEPWVDIKSVTLSEENPAQGSFELDWNETFVQELRAVGYDAPSDEAVVDLWLSTLCKNIALEEFSGDGNNAQQFDESFAIKKRKIDEDRWEVK